VDTFAVQDEATSALYGAKYFAVGIRDHILAPASDSYFYEVFVGGHLIDIQRGDCAYWLDSSQRRAHLTRGPERIESSVFATLIRGYSPDNRSCEFTETTVLPYVNGCSTKQIFAPERPGDPTLQLLKMPAHSSEQAHHIHSTARCVFVLSGRGRSMVGMQPRTSVTELSPGMVCIFDKMCPHHFETEDSPLVVLPVHVWSTVPGVENLHPMFAGTFKT
jgi:mannose-6-phosphate isomerase-like protein (cupin superfamily)